MILKRAKDIPFQYPNFEKHLLSIYNALAAYYISLAMKEQDKSKASNYFDEATIYLNSSDKLDMTEPFTWLCKGILMIYKLEILSSKESERIDYQLNYVLQKFPKSIPALLAKVIFFHVTE